MMAITRDIVAQDPLRRRRVRRRAGHPRCVALPHGVFRQTARQPPSARPLRGFQTPANLRLRRAVRGLDEVVYRMIADAAPSLRPSPSESPRGRGPG
jgi:hypothetical protein